jgi:hypothetical protein
LSNARASSLARRSAGAAVAPGETGRGTTVVVLAATQPAAELAETVWTPPVSWLTTCPTRLLGIANPTPMLPEDCPLTLALAVVIPTTWPAALTSGPPELPG